MDFFSAFTDTAGLTYSWGEAYRPKQNISEGDQPHNWADSLWVGLFRRLFVMEDGNTLLLTPATFRRWQQGDKGVRLSKLPTEFGDLELSIEPRPDGSLINYRFKLTPVGDHAKRRLEKIVVNARTPQGRKVATVKINGAAGKAIQPAIHADLALQRLPEILEQEVLTHRSADVIPWEDLVRAPLAVGVECRIEPVLGKGTAPGFCLRMVIPSIELRSVLPRAVDHLRHATVTAR